MELWVMFILLPFQFSCRASDVCKSMLPSLLVFVTRWVVRLQPIRAYSK